MAEGSLASAVALPEPENVLPSPEAGLKRRQSSISNSDEHKRRRLSSTTTTQDDHPYDRRPSLSDRKQSSPDAGPERKADRKPTRAGGRDEERKRGQRLFGGLLGTLSQSSNSVAQRRRADIERRQKDKLKLQDEEYDELKKKRRGERAAIRKKEQRLYEEESMRTRHSNLLAMARFLKTRAEPVLYYKPWQLRPDDHATIRDQIEDAEATIAREEAEFKERYPPQQEGHPEQEQEPQEPTREGNLESAAAPEKRTEAETDAKEKETTQQASHPGDTETQHEKSTEEAPTDVPAPNEHNPTVHHQHSDVHRGHEDDGGEVVEDQEDTVIY